MTNKIEELEKEIGENITIFRTLDNNAQKRLEKEFERITKSERLVIIHTLQAELKGLKEGIEIGKIQAIGEFKGGWVEEGRQETLAEVEKLLDERMKLLEKAGLMLIGDSYHPAYKELMELKSKLQEMKK